MIALRKLGEKADDVKVGDIVEIYESACNSQIYWVWKSAT